MPIQLHTHVIIILLSGIVILSYLYNVLSRKTRIPSVLLLIATGIVIKYGLDANGYRTIDVHKLVKILGSVGIIMIILEAAMDLEVNKSKFPLVRNSFLAALGIFLLSAFGIASLLAVSLHQPFQTSLIYAIPMSIISSAIVIPSTEHLPAEKKEFIIYESSFSDIMGILVFNYLLMDNILSIRAVGIFAGNIVFALIISALASLLMLFILSRITLNVRFFLMFAILALVYSAGELIHIPALLIVLIFGLVLNNSSLLLRGKFSALVESERLEGMLHLMRSITAETSFLLRTFFFILFGYSIDIHSLAHRDVIIIGSLIVGVLLICRFLYLRLILKTNVFPELFLMPRGLVTILLFYSIPPTHSMATFDPGILFFVVVVSSLLMMFGLLFFRQEDRSML